MSDPPGFQGDARFLGKWRTDGSVLTLDIHMDGASYAVDATDSSNGEKFEVTRIDWSDGVLRFHLRLPSNGYETDHTVTPRDGELDDHLVPAHHLVFVRVS